MRHCTSRSKRRLADIFLFALLVGLARIAQADPSKYPQFAQQSLPENITPTFITVDELVEVIRAGAKPLIVDVRTEEEFKEAHILSALSAPLAEFNDHLKNIPRDRPVVLY